MENISNSFFNINILEKHIEQLVSNYINNHHSISKEWMNIKEACEYIGISFNTFAKYRKMGLKISEVNGTKRVSRTEIDAFLKKHSN